MITARSLSPSRSACHPKCLAEDRADADARRRRPASELRALQDPDADSLNGRPDASLAGRAPRRIRENPDIAALDHLVPSRFRGAVAGGHETRRERGGEREGGVDIASSLRVLIVDDDPVNRLVVAEALARLGHKAHAVRDGREALASLGREDYDLVLMDCQMPGLGGLEATRRLRRLGHQVRVVAYTSLDDATIRDRCLAAGMDDLLPKPFELRELRAVMHRASGAVDGTVSGGDLNLS